MDRIAVTVAGVVGWLGAGWLVVRLRHGSRQPWRPPEAGGWRARLPLVAARVSGSVAAALVAGVLVLGLGGRLMMRVLAATSPDGAQGRLTDAEEVVGRVTLEGTVGFILFTGVFGAVLGLALFSVLRRWLPARSIGAGLLTAGIGGGPLVRMSGLLDPGNPDFGILSPTWLAVALALMIVLTFALCAAVLIDRWAPAWPVPGRSLRGTLGLAPLAPMLMAGPPGFAVLALIGVRALPAFSTPADDRPSGHAARAVRAAVVVASVVGWGWVLVSAADIIVG